MSSLKPAQRESLQWRSLDEWIASESGRAAAIEAMPQLATLAPALDRRAFVKLIAGSLALAGLAGCSGPPEETIVPWRERPVGMPDAAPAFYATTLAAAGEIAGVLVETHEGRPTKIEGNPSHPASLGATDAFMQAAILELWDPDRSQAPTHRGAAASWDDFLASIAGLDRRIGARGAGLRIVSPRIASPTLARQRDALLARHPDAKWHVVDAVGDDAAIAGARLAFGVAARPRYDLSGAARIVALDADFLAAMPGRLRHARAFAAGRVPPSERDANAARSSPPFNRLYAIESTPTLTGTMADHRWPLASNRIDAFLRELAATLGIDAAAPSRPNGIDPDRIRALAADLDAHRGAAPILVGRSQPAETHALALRVNRALGNLGRGIDLVRVADEADHDASLRELVDAMASGAVDTIVILDGNPAYSTPLELGFAKALARVPHSIHLGLHADETADIAEWHLPRTHALEAWSDLRADDGSASLVQPVIAPLYDARSEHELIAALLGADVRDGHAIVRETWRSVAGTDFDAFWETSLRDGIIADAPRAAAIDAGALTEAAARIEEPAATGSGDDDAIEIVFRPDATIWDGRHANNAWLQELPKSLTQLTWSNAALISPALAKAHDLADGDVVEIAANGTNLRTPVWILPGQAERTVTLTLGYGRRRAGRVGSGIGVDVFAIRSAKTPWRLGGASIAKTGAQVALASTQRHHRMEGRQPVRVETLDDLVDRAIGEATPGSFYDDAPQGDVAWGMSVDLNACIGCKACTIACQAENNIPVVGAEEVRRGREMQWLRVDRYYAGDATAPATYHQPVPCMHCEHAPCEIVCPVGATVHDHDGLNVQVYNRCVGTRFCANNCPYKVRRFNFLQYADLHADTMKAVRNPDVTVRNRGVMEKCTYCIQRIERAHIAADRQSRPIADGEVVTACQAVCPTRAITFGNLADAGSAVVRAKRSSRNYDLLAELNTRPRTSYLARVANPNPAIGDRAAAKDAGS